MHRAGIPRKLARGAVAVVAAASLGGAWAGTGTAFATTAPVATAHVASATAASVSPPSGWRAVDFAGERFDVPASWPTVDTATDPTACVRFDRHAVYLGPEGAQALCPTAALGVVGAVQVERVASAPAGLVASSVGGQPAEVAADPAVSRRSVAWFPGTGVEASVTWGSDAATAEEVLASFRAAAPSGAGSVVTTAPSGTAAPTGAAASTAPSAGSPGPARVAGPVQTSATGSTSTSTSTQVGAAVATVLGFDACGAPSTSDMSAWLRASPYRAVGVYLGGANAACGGEGLSPSWVTTETTAGWDLVPIYVGLQAPCADQSGLAPIQPAHAAAEGAAAAKDAVTEASANAIAPGSPIYFDMEAWNTANTTCSTAVVDFIESWTTTLHTLGYQSGMYGSADSGIAQDIAPIYGQAGAPDDLWFAEWDGSTAMTSPYIPASDWPGQTRLKQYSGNVTQTYGGAKINIDQDSISGAVVGLGQPVVVSLSGHAGAPLSKVIVTGAHFATASTTVRFGGVPSPDVLVRSSGSLVATVPPTVPGAAEVTVTTGGGGTSATNAASAYLVRSDVAAAADLQSGGYRSVTPEGNVVNIDAPWYGSKAGVSLPAPIIGMATDPQTGGYWLVTAAGNVYHFHAPWFGSPFGHLPAGVSVVGMAADPQTGGYWVTTSAGNVYHFHAPWFGSPFGHLPAGASIVGVAADGSTGGYWTARSTGQVEAYHAPSLGGFVSPPAAPVVAITPTSSGYRLLTAGGAALVLSPPAG